MKSISIKTIPCNKIKRQEQFWHMQYSVCQKRSLLKMTDKNLENEFVSFNNWKILQEEKKWIMKKDLNS